MHQEHIDALASTFDSFPTQGVCVVDGYGIKIRVDRRHLVISDGIGAHRREARFHKATHKLERLVVSGHTGYISLEAIRWLAEAGIGFVHLDANGRLLATSTDLGLNHPSLRRAQALAANEPIGVDITRRILQRKLEGQAANAQALDSVDATDEIEQSIDRLEEADTLNELLIIEAQAANTYWGAWTDLQVLYPKNDSDRIPDHWHTFGQRGSGLGSGARLATNPANATLNYLYALLEAEARIACAKIGLDPGIGILHADQKARDSIALDIMEAVRPNVDAYLIELLESHRFRASAFHETRRGDCRILAPLTHVLTATVMDWRRLLAPVVEAVASDLLDAARTTRKSRLPTPLTQRRRSEGRGKEQRSSHRGPSTLDIHACLDCGAQVASRRKRCKECDQRFQADRLRSMGNDELNAMRQAGRDPNKTPSARKAVSDANRDHWKARKDWNPKSQPTDPDYFRREIFPHLGGHTARDLARATSLSIGYSRLIAKGEKIPHPRHWPALQEMIARQRGSGPARVQ